MTQSPAPTMPKPPTMTRPPTRSRVTIQDIAQQAGVSKMTVSKVLNNQGSISEATRKKVLTLARDLGYVSNFAARSLKGGRTNVLGMLVANIGDLYFAEMVRGASDGARSVGKDLLLLSTGGDVNTSQDEQRRVSLLAAGIADGLLIALPRSSHDFLQSVRRAGTPVVLVNDLRPEDELPTVNGENYHGAYAAVTHLLDLGHTRIAFIGGDRRSGQTTVRQQAYLDAGAARGIQFAPEYLQAGDFKPASGFQATLRLLDLPQPPSAIFAANDSMALGVLDAARQRGLSVPDDLSVVGFDDLTAAQAFPPLTSVRHPLYQMGYQAALLLNDLVDSPREAGERLIRELPSELVVRQSTAAPRETGQALAVAPRPKTPRPRKS